VRIVPRSVPCDNYWKLASWHSWFLCANGTIRKNLTLILSAWTTTTMLRLLIATTKKLILTNGCAAFLATIPFKAATMAVALVFQYQGEEVVVFFRKLLRVISVVSGRWSSNDVRKKGAELHWNGWYDRHLDASICLQPPWWKFESVVVSTIFPRFEHKYWRWFAQ